MTLATIDSKKCGSLLMFFGIMLGAFGAHALKGKVSSEDLEIFHTGAFYQLIHGVALIAIYTQKPNRLAQYAVLIMTVATVIFSGTLYLIVLTGIRTFGAITPIGGLGLIIAWGLYFLSRCKEQVDSQTAL